MATLREADPTSLNGSDKELPTQEGAVREQPDLRTPESRHVDVLLDMSEEDFLKELEPHEYHCYSGWEEAVRGWARVAPLSCILLPQNRSRKEKHKEVDIPTSLSVDPTLANAESSASIAESHTGASNSLKNSTLLNQQTGCWSHTAAAALRADASEWTVLGAVQKTPSHLLLEGKTHNLPSTYCVSENGVAKPPKRRHRHNGTVLPIRNFTFLPPIKSPHLNPKFDGQLCSGKKASVGEEALHESGFMFDRKSEPVANTEFPTYSAALMSKYQTCKHNLNLFSTVSVSVPKRYRVPTSSKPDTVLCSSYSMAKSLTPALQSSAAVGAQRRMHPSCLFS